MQDASRPTRACWSIGRKVSIAAAVALVLAGLLAAPAFADRGEGHDRGRHYGDHGQRHWRGERGGRDDDYAYRPMGRPPYRHAQPVYVPPPVYDAPQQSPGISLFFPLDLRR